MDEKTLDEVTARCSDVRAQLLGARPTDGVWTGELSSSALSTATALSALSLVRGHHDTTDIEDSLRWLAATGNPDGGWGDTTRSVSNISTTLLVRAAFHLTGGTERYRDALARSDEYVRKAGGLAAVEARYGRDKTFSAPILTNCALASLADWPAVRALPFELACLPGSWFRWLRLPVVSYALPALIAIGQVRHHHCPPRLAVVRWIRNQARQRSLDVLERIQPPNGGFLEATPLTSFVTMSLAGMGLAHHPVARKGAQFLASARRPDGTWPIDSNLSVWLTTLSVNALSDGEPADELPGADGIRDWLLAAQFRQYHPFTGADPGGWGWTDRPGSVPDVDDTSGALLALHRLGRIEQSKDAALLGTGWLLSIQNSDGGWPTFCRGWGHLPFDRSAPELTGHALRALHAWRPHLPARQRRIDRATASGLQYLRRTQHPDGYWVPLWFGNQFAPQEENRTYGTARVLVACRCLGTGALPLAEKAVHWLRQAQNSDGGWGGAPGTPSTVEETAQALDGLLGCGLRPGMAGHIDTLERGTRWLCRAIRDGRQDEASPIGLYFARLWYFEKLYPILFAAAALHRLKMT